MLKYVMHVYYIQKRFVVDVTYYVLQHGRGPEDFADQRPSTSWTPERLTRSPKADLEALRTSNVPVLALCLHAASTNGESLELAHQYK